MEVLIFLVQCHVTDNGAAQAARFAGSLWRSILLLLQESELSAPGTRFRSVRDIDFQHLEARQDSGDIPVKGRKESSHVL